MEPRPIPVNGSAALAVVPTANVVTADEWDERREQFIRQNYCNDAPDPEASAFITICKRRGLAPEEKQIYLIKRAGKWTVQTSIDGYRLIAERTRCYAGSDEPIFVESGEKLSNGRSFPLKATVTVWKVVDGVRCPFTASAYWEEYNGGQNLWLTMPHVMLAKCAECQALRKAFPADLSGIYTVEEMDQAEREERPAARPSAKVKPATGNGKPAPAKAIPAGQPAGETDPLKRAMARLHALGAERNVSHEQLHDLAVARYDVPSLAECSREQLTELGIAVRECDADQALDLVTVAVAISESGDAAYLDHVAAETNAVALPDEAKAVLLATIERVRGRIAA